MYRPRVIPVLLIRDGALVKSIQFKQHKYIGDPINAVRIFNDLKADELAFIDIEATQKGRLISLDFVRDVGEEANMPFAVGGGIKTIDDIQSIIAAGAEKVIINSEAAKNPAFIQEASDIFGSSTITVCIDVKKTYLKGLTTWTDAGSKATKLSPVEHAQMAEQNGAGELIIQSISHDGMMNGYDLELIESIARAVKIPVVALGGAGTIEDLHKAHHLGYANGMAAGSLFVFQSKNRGVLINYPEKDELRFDIKPPHF